MQWNNDGILTQTNETEDDASDRNSNHLLSSLIRTILIYSEITLAAHWGLLFFTVFFLFLCQELGASSSVLFLKIS